MSAKRRDEASCSDGAAVYSYFYCVHGDGAHVHAGDRKGGGLAWLLLRNHVQQRQIMLGGRHAPTGVGAGGLIIDERVVIAGQQLLFHLLGKTLRPFERRRVRRPVQAAEVVNDVATADDEYVLVAQYGETSGERIMPLRRLGGIDAELHHRDVGGRKGMDQHRPSAVIETPALSAVGVESLVYRHQHLLHAAGEVG